ncbi:MAG: adenosylcobalamin-dependent ribonucleoside-diphosphate reductase [Planctomycetota bacterium]|nr:MAG: adenosylcobalamin-dependent ribonucleoside-diphosphate reductase [Planctomycetota bacterium]
MDLPVRSSLIPSFFLAVDRAWEVVMEPSGEVSKAVRRRMNPEIENPTQPCSVEEPTVRPLPPMPADLPEPTLTENAEKVLRNRYLKKDKVTGEVVEEPREMFWRVAAAVAAPEFEVSEENGLRWARRFYDLMARNVFVPNSPTLMNAGREMGMLSACFVLPVEDSIESIFTTLKHVALIQKAGGGTGFSFSRLRPDGDIVSTSGGATSGPLSFIDAYSAGTDAIQQGAFRRGANMGVLRCDHPDVVEFIRAKDDLSRWTNYNVSVAVTNEWMQAVVDKPDERMVVVNPRNGCKAWLKKIDGGRRISLADYEAFSNGEPETGAEYWTYGEVMDRIVHFAWKNGEPGLLFLDRANEDNMLPNLGQLESTNPCGEQWLLPYSSCNLGSINLGRFFKANAPEAAPWDERIDWEAFDAVVHETVRFLDDVVSINRFPIPEIRRQADLERRIGLGVMGFADLLYKLGIRYGSEKSYEVGRRIGKRLRDTAIAASEALVAEEGREPFGAWEGSRPQLEGRPPRRNSHLTTVAPTGTISIIAGCSGGIEPLFSLAFQRQVMKDADGNPVVMTEVNPVFRQAMERAGLSEEEMEQAVEQALADGTIAHTSLPEELRKVFVTAHDVEPREHILMQAAWQEHIDNAVSKTINLPNSCSEDDVRTAYLLAWREGCKGVTVYRDGCREMQPMALKKKEEEQAAARAEADPRRREITPMRLPEIMPCVRVRQMTPFGNVHVKISVDPVVDREMEVFAQLGKGGDVANSDLEAICRMISLFLRCGGRLEMALQQLEGIGSSLTVPSKDGRIMSLADGLAKALRKYRWCKQKFGLKAILLGEVDPAEMALPGSAGSGPARSGRAGTGTGGAFKVKCPACNGVLTFEEGCCKCYSCGYSQC